MKVKVDDLYHLGIVAGIVDQIGIVELIGDRHINLSQMRTVDAQRIKTEPLCTESA